MDRLYVLSRTQGRPDQFARMRESVRALTWPGGVTHIVHTCDPRDIYVDGDIIVKGEVHGPYMGTAPYNLYNNRLIEAVTEPGWVAFMDDDDEYAAPDVFERLLHKADKKIIHTGQAARWGDTVWNTDPNDKKRNIFQTECFSLWWDLAKKAKWPGDKGGDHYYTRRLTKKIPWKWHEVLIARAQDGKGRGKLEDRDLDGCYPPEKKVTVKMFVNAGNKRGAGQLHDMPYFEARVFERHGMACVSYRGVEICTQT